MQPEFEIELYNERLNALFSRFQSVQKVGFTGDAYKPGLDGMRRLSTLLGDPWRAYPCVHVAGTNGKGSVCSMLAAALAGGGAVRSATATHGLTQKTSANCTAPRHVGLYTSPHLLDFRERMKIVSGDGYEMISREEVWEFLNVYEAELEGLSFFEVTTGMAFWWFAKRGVDAAVIEAGLGGRLDSTNIITPVLSVITSIGLDHCALLGSTRSAIAWEKAGIFKPGVPAVVGVRDDETAPVFEAAALVLGTPLTFASDVPTFDGEPELLSRVDLTGPCQNLNLHTVLVALAVIASPTALTATADNAPPIWEHPSNPRLPGAPFDGPLPLPLSGGGQARQGLAPVALLSARNFSAASPMTTTGPEAKRSEKLLASRTTGAMSPRRSPAGE